MCNNLQTTEKCRSKFEKLIKTWGNITTTTTPTKLKPTGEMPVIKGEDGHLNLPNTL